MSASDARITFQVTEADFLRPIIKIRLVGSVPDKSPANVMYHWRFYLVIEEKKSIIFDMVPDTSRTATVVPGRLWIRSYDDVKSRAAIKVELDLEAVEGATVGHFFDVYMQAGLGRYHFTSDGQGCLWHSFRVLQEMEKNGIAAEGSEARVHEWLRSMFRDPRDDRVVLQFMPQNRREGTYGN